MWLWSRADAPYIKKDAKYCGVVVDGPKVGEVLRSDYLTIFIARTPEPILYPENIRHDIAREQIKRNIEAWHNPYRYDYNLEKQVWEYVHYESSSLPDSPYW